MEEQKKYRQIVNFLTQVGKLKERKRRGWILNGIRNPETTAGHTFRMIMLVWLLGKEKKGLDLEKILKMALIHDICEVYTWDETPYDPLVPRDTSKKKEIRKVLDKWPNFTLAQKKKKAEKKHERELKSLKKLVSSLPNNLSKKIINLWQEFDLGLSREGRFVRQADKAENYLQGIEYWERDGKIKYKLWSRWAKEIFDDPVLIKFCKAVDRNIIQKKLRFLKKRKTRKKDKS